MAQLHDPFNLGKFDDVLQVLDCRHSLGIGHRDRNDHPLNDG